MILTQNLKNLAGSSQHRKIQCIIILLIWWGLRAFFWILSPLDIDIMDPAVGHKRMTQMQAIGLPPTSDLVIWTCVRQCFQTWLIGKIRRWRGKGPRKQGNSPWVEMFNGNTGTREKPRGKHPNGLCKKLKSNFHGTSAHENGVPYSFRF